MTLVVKRPSELISRADTSKWLVDGLWQVEGVGIISAEPKCGKTWLALDLAVSVASGSKCLNHYPVNKTGRVMFYNGEDAEHMQSARLKALALAKDLDHTKLNLGIVSAEKLRLDIDADVDDLRAAVSRERPVLLILDPFVRLHQVNENNSADVAGILSKLRKIQRDFGTAVILVHHAKKSAARNARGGSKMRGSGELHAWGDSNLYLAKDREGHVMMDIEHRNAESLIDVPLTLVTKGEATGLQVGFEPIPEEIALPEIEPATPEQRLVKFDSLKSVSRADLNDEQVLGALRRFGPLRTSALLQFSGLPHVETALSVHRLCKTGRVEKTPEGYVRARPAS